jgi:hypothetical protein
LKTLKSRRAILNCSAPQDYEGVYTDEVFATNTWLGTGAALNIANGIDLAQHGGLVICRARNSLKPSQMTDTVRGARKAFDVISTAAPVDTSGITSFNASGFTLGDNASFNAAGVDMVSWTFRRKAGFFDVVEYTGNGAIAQAIAHSLGGAPGAMFVKAQSGASNIGVYHRGFAVPATTGAKLNSDAAETTGVDWWGSTNPTSNHFTVGPTYNSMGVKYIAYLFGHDTSPDGVIQCGRVPAVTASIELGWEPQFLLNRIIGAQFSWQTLDDVRGFFASPSAGSLSLEMQNQAGETASSFACRTATGYTQAANANPYIYIAIRRSNKPPTSGYQVFCPALRTGTGGTATVRNEPFPLNPDLAIIANRAGGGASYFDRLRGSIDTRLQSSNTNAEAAFAAFTAWRQRGYDIDGAPAGVNDLGAAYLDLGFKRAVQVFDQVCYTGTGVAKTEAHSLLIVPELMIVKRRYGVDDWLVYHAAAGSTKFMKFNDTQSEDINPNYWSGTTPTDAVFSVGTAAAVNANGAIYVAYLFATLAGVSKVGTYTGNGASLDIDCGFGAGARFVLVKNRSAAGDWFIWDSIRGIVVGSDPHLSLNTTAAEVGADDSLSPLAAGFTVNQLVATNVNVTGQNYLFLAIA